MDFKNVAAQIARLKELDPDCILVGASEHNYDLQPPLDDKAAAAFERENNVQLPPDYRTFLTEVASSGAGPGQGLLPLGFNWGERSNPGGAFGRGSLDGLVPLCSYEEEIWDVLVVEGDNAGTVWNLANGSLDDWYNPDGSGLMRFDAWYLGWLAQVTLALSE